MAGVGKKLLSLFIEVDEAESKKEPSAKPGSADKVAAPPPVPPNSKQAIPVNVAAGLKDDSIARSIADALEKANLSGFDYFEYAKMIDALKMTIPAEQALYQMAFTSGVVMGINKKMLLDSAQHYIDVLEKEAQKFALSVEEQVAQTVGGKEEQVRTIETEIAGKAGQIQKLTEEINELSNQKNTLTNEISENRIKIEKVQNDFGATMQLFEGKIRSDLEKIVKYVV